MLPWYVTREAVKSALDVKETARADADVDRAIDAASRAVEALTRRRFYPEHGTRYFDWPNRQYARPWRLWLESNEAVSVSSLTSGGVAIPADSYWLRRPDRRTEPPYTLLELDLDSDAAFGQGGTHQRDIAVTGVFGYGADSDPASALATAIDASSTTVAVTDGSAVGVGDLLLVDDERMQVTGRTMADTGVTLTAALTAQHNAVTVTVSSSSGAPVPGEVLLVDSERMLVVDAAGTSLTVRRAWDGSTLAAHDSAAAVWASRLLTVQRAAVGTTAASHADTAPVSRHRPPGLVTALCEAYALNTLLQRRAGYARVAGRKGQGEDNTRENTGRGIAGLEGDVCAAYRRARIGVV